LLLVSGVVDRPVVSGSSTWSWSGLVGEWSAGGGEGCAAGSLVELLPRGLPGPVLGQVQGEPAGGAGEPGGHVDQLGAQGREPRAGVEARGEAAAARVRLNAMLASTSQAALALKVPDGRCASGPSLSSAMTCSMIAWPRWAASASSIRRGELVNTAVRHEALLFRAEVEGLRGWPVVEGR